MAKSIFYINLVCQGEKKSIQKISDQLIDLMLIVSKIDPIFLAPVFIGDKVNYEINISSDYKAENANILANKILDSNRADIKRYEKEKNLTIDFSRDFGFRVLLQFFLAGKKRFSLNAKLGSSDYQELKIEYFNSEFEYDFEWYYSVFKCLVESLKPSYGGVIISLSSFFDRFVNLNVWPPLGWINYFSNDFEITIPNNLVNWEYEFNDQGKYLIISKDDFTHNDQTYEVYLKKLLDTMEQIKKEVPNYKES